MSESKYKPINEEPDVLALIILILSFLGAVGGFFMFGFVDVLSPYGSRVDVAVNWPAVGLILVSLLYAVAIFMLCTRVKTLSQRNKQQEEILIRLAEKFDV